jgi:hypothetical protein
MAARLYRARGHDRRRCNIQEVATIASATMNATAS